MAKAANVESLELTSVGAPLAGSTARGTVQLRAVALPAKGSAYVRAARVRWAALETRRSGLMVRFEEVAVPSEARERLSAEPLLWVLHWRPLSAVPHWEQELWVPHWGPLLAVPHWGERVLSAAPHWELVVPQQGHSRGLRYLRAVASHRSKWERSIACT